MAVEPEQVVISDGNRGKFVTVHTGFVLAAILWEICLERAGSYLAAVGSALSMQPLSFDRY